MLESLLSVIAPDRCRVCGAPLARGTRFVCEPCLYLFDRTGEGRDPYANPLMDRLLLHFVPEKAASIFRYSRNEDIAELIHQMKYRDCPSLAKVFGRVAADELAPLGFFSDVDVMMGAPMFFLKKLVRGYNQAELIARAISREIGVPVSTDLKAIRPHAPQMRRSGLKRMRLKSQNFKLLHANNYHGKHILLVDDVCTTGATLGAAAQAILEATGRTAKVSALAIASVSNI